MRCTDRWGEDGLRAGPAELIGMALYASGVLASALAMHKERAKEVMRAAGIPRPTARSCAVRRRPSSRVAPAVWSQTRGEARASASTRSKDHEHPRRSSTIPAGRFGEELLPSAIFPAASSPARLMGGRCWG